MRRSFDQPLLPLALVLSLTCARTVPAPEVQPEVAPQSDEPALIEEVGASSERQDELPDEAEEETAVVEPAAEPGAAAGKEASPVPRMVRVGLATDVASVVLPCCDAEPVAVHGGQPIAVVSSMVVEPGVEISQPTVFRLQISALRDEAQAAELARRVAELSGHAATVVFDAGSGLYKVRVGSFSTREEAQQGRRTLAQRNLHEAWVVSEQTPPRNPALKLTQGDRQWMARSRWLTFEPRGPGQGIAVLGKRYRGRILVFLNDRGTLNVINELPLDDYLRGVVPREMGPEVFDNVEALKAQSIAARSYTLRNMGEFASEGFDICATPRCQVYGGMDAEHPLSDRAVLETSGEVLLFEGDYVDALYSSTCGGHTEHVETVFPLKNARYLRGVPCHESGVDRMAGSLPRGTPLEVGIARLLEPLPLSGDPVSVVGERFRNLLDRAGITTRSDTLRSLERREVQRFIAAQLQLDHDATLLVNEDDVPYLLEAPPPESWEPEDLRVAAYLLKQGFFPGPLEAELSSREIDEAIFRLGLFLRVLEEREVRYLGLDDGSIRVREGGEEGQYELPATLATFSRRTGDFGASTIGLVPGDRIRLYSSRDGLIGIAHEVDLDGAAFDRTSNLSSWTRFRSDEELAERVRERYPSLEFSGFEVLERGVSGRAGRMMIHGSNGASAEVRGLPIRWTLDLPDTLFTAKRLAPADGASGWLFTGRGWGHGVGMCQVGSYGMAVRGHDYRDILHHYYSGVELWDSYREGESTAPQARLPSAD